MSVHFHSGVPSVAHRLADSVESVFIQGGAGSTLSPRHGGTPCLSQTFKEDRRDAAKRANSRLIGQFVTETFQPTLNATDRLQGATFLTI